MIAHQVGRYDSPQASIGGFPALVARRGGWLRRGHRHPANTLGRTHADYAVNGSVSRGARRGHTSRRLNTPVEVARRQDVLA
jgi:hypothetical protein